MSNILANANRYNPSNTFRSDNPGNTRGNARRNEGASIGFDCSGLVYHVLRESGYNVPYATSAVMPNDSTFNGNWATPVKEGSSPINPGTLVYFSGHVGIVQSYDPETKIGKFLSMTGSHNDGLIKPSETFTTNGTLNPGIHWGGAAPFKGFAEVKPELYDRTLDQHANGANPDRPVFNIPEASNAGFITLPGNGGFATVRGATDLSARADVVAAGHNITPPAPIDLPRADTAFATLLAFLESRDQPNNGYGAWAKDGSGIGAVGRYGFRAPSLRAIGWLDGNGEWTDKARANGVSSTESFRDTPDAQELARVEYMAMLKTELRANGSWAMIGKTVDGHVVTEAGLLAAAWKEGSGAVQRFFNDEAGTHAATNIAFRLDRFEQCQMAGESAAGAAANNNPVATTGHWEYPETLYNATGDFSGAAEPVWVADTKDSSSASTSTTPPKTSTSSPGRTSATTAPHTDVTHHSDGSTTYSFTAKANSADGTIQRGDAVTQTFDAQGQLSYYSVTHSAPGKNGETTVMERMPLAGPGEATSAFSQWVGNSLQFQGQWDADGARVGERYITGGVTYSRSSAEDGSTRWLDPNGLSANERVQQSFDQETLRRFSSAPPLTLEDPPVNAAPLDSTPQPTSPEPFTPPDTEQSSFRTLSSEELQALQAGLNQIAAMTSQPGVLYADASAYTDSGIISDAGPGTAEPSPQANTAAASTTAAQQSANALGLMNSILGLQHWEGMNDLQRTAAVVSIYNALDKVNDNALSGGSSGDLGSVAGALGLFNALDQGNMGAALYSGLGLVESLTFNTAQGAGLVSGQLGGNFLPALGFVLALDSGDPVSIASSGVALYGAMTGAAWAGPVGLGIALAGAVLGNLFADNDIPMREGLAHAAWDSAGNTLILTDQDNEGGGATAASWMGSLVDALQTQLATVNDVHDAAGKPYALVPDLLPAIGFAYDPDGFNLANGARGFVYLRWTDEQGQSQTRYYDGAGKRGDGTGETLAGDFMQHAQRAIAPDWAVATALAHFQQGQGIALPQAAASLPQHLADGLQQSLQTITLDLPQEVARQESRPNQALLDIDGDGYLERSQWLATDQQALAIDANGDQAITPDELLSLDGNTPSLHNLRWLDANCDQLIDTRDPAFAAIRLWRDGNADGYSDGDEDDPSDQLQTLSQAGILAIDFSHSPPSLVRADGSRQTLTVQELTGDVLGVRYQAVTGGVLQQDEQASGEATLTLHAVNTLAFQAQAGHVHGGEETKNLAPDSNTLNVGRVIQAGDSALSTVARSATGAGTVFVPLQASTGSSNTHNPVRQVTAAMVRSADTANWLPLAALALGASAGAGAAPASAATSAWPGLTTTAAPPGSAAAPMPTAQPPFFSTSSAGLNPDPDTDPARLGASPPSPPSLAGFDQTAASQPASSTPNADFEQNTGLAQYSYAPAAINSIAYSTSVAIKTAPNFEPYPESLAPASHTANPEPANGLLLQAPEVQGERATGTEDAPLRFSASQLLVNDSSANDNIRPRQSDLHISAVGSAQHGTVSLQQGEGAESGQSFIVFSPQANYHGPAQFSYTVSDAYGLSRSAQVSLDIAAVNDAPHTQGESVNGDEDQTLYFTAASLLANDSDVDTATDGDVLHISRVGLAQHGSVSLAADGSIAFVPDANYHGPAQFSYWVSDREDEGSETLATVTLTLQPVNDLPQVTGEVIDSDEDIPLNIAPALLLANDVDVDSDLDAQQTLTLSAVGDAQHGSVALLADGSVQFNPDANYYGSASFRYTVDDGHGGQASAQVLINLAPVNDAPSTQDELLWGKRDVRYTFSAAALLANDADIDSDHAALHISAIANSQHGTAQLNTDGSVSFSPEAGYSGRASFDYIVQDEQGASSSATASIDFSRSNINPLATDDSFSGYEDIALSISAEQLLINDSDADNAAPDLHISAVQAAQHGSVSLQADGSVYFVPEADFSGTASFSYQVSDGDGGQTWAQAQLAIQAVNDAPLIEAILYGRPLYGYTRISYLGSGDGDTGRTDIIAIHDAAQAQDLADNRSLFASDVPGMVQLVVPTYYRNGHMRPIDVDIRDATVYSTDNEPIHVDDRYRQMGLIEAYDPDGDSSALTFSVASGPQHGHAWANQYTDPAAPTEMDHTQVGPYWQQQTGAWQYYSQRGDGYTGADPFSIAITDEAGASTQLTLNTQHTGSSISGSGGKKPVTLDLDGNGLTYLSLDDSQAHFDVNADGWRDHLAWVGAGDGLLVRDIGADRQIDRFDEISFTGYTPDATSDLEGLQAFDSNHNGLLDKLDQRWGEFGVWQDSGNGGNGGTGNGVSERGEFQTLDEIGISQISLHSDQQVRQLDGVTELGQSQFTWADGRTGAVGDVVLAVKLTVPDTAPPAELPATSPAAPHTAIQQHVQESVAQAKAQAYLNSLARQEPDDDIDYMVSPPPIALPPLPPMTAMTPQHLALLMVQTISAVTADSPDIPRPMQATSPQDVHQALADIQAQWEQAANPALLHGGGV